MGSSRLLPLTSGVGWLLSASALARPSQPPRWIMEKARAFQKNTYFCFIDYAKAFDCVDTHFGGGAGAGMTGLKDAEGFGLSGWKDGAAVS